jgi:HPt (histidine-containing phosphotransfer) domain-containing protein
MTGGELPPAPVSAPVAPAPTEEGPPGSSHPFHVRIDPDLADLVPGYLDHRRQDVQKAREHLERGDFEAVRVVGHSIAGSGGTYGFPGITRIGRLIERSGQAKDAEAVRMALVELESYLKRVVVDYAEPAG